METSEEMASLEAELADLEPQHATIANRLIAIQQRLELLRHFERWQQDRPEDWTVASE